jgi:hypothetical protein
MKNIIFILALLLTSCGSRKVAINNTEIKKDSTAITEVKVEEEIKVEIEEKTNVFVFDEAEEIEISPIDTSKVMYVDGKIYENVVIRAKKNKSGIIHTNNIKASQTQRIDSVSRSVVIKKEQTNTKTKNIDKKESIITNIWLWLFLLFIIIIIITIVRKLIKIYFI